MNNGMIEVAGEVSAPDAVPNVLLVLTACVDPGRGGARVARSDPATRLEDYRRALRFWLDHPDPRFGSVLFLENSGYCLDSLQRECTRNPLKKRVEFISVPDHPLPAGMHYGYAELRMLDCGTARSELMRGADYFCKVTGRLTFPALPKLLDRLPRDFLFAVDARGRSMLAPRRPQFVTTQLMIFNRHFYDAQLRSAWRKMAVGELTIIELLFWRELMRYHGRPGCILRWPVNVDAVGIGAHWNKDYGSLRQRGVNAMRAAARRVAPQWWI